MWLAGFSLDNLSLMALTIGTGFIVDDAIVMLENIVRHIEAGEKPMDAAFKGSKEVGFSIISMTLSLIAVFIPVQTASRHAARVGMLRVRLEHLEVNPRLEHCAFLQRGLLLLVRRRHLAVADVDERLVPQLPVGEQLRVRLVSVILHAALLRAVRVAVEAILLQQRQHVFRVGQLRRVLRGSRAKERRVRDGREGQQDRTGEAEEFHARTR